MANRAYLRSHAKGYIPAASEEALNKRKTHYLAKRKWDYRSRGALGKGWYAPWRQRSAGETTPAYPSPNESHPA